MDKILDVMEDIKQNITDNQYKTIMDALKEIHDIKKLEIPSFKYVSLINWLDTKLEFNRPCHHIKKKDLHKYIIKNFYEDRYDENIDFVKQALKFYFLDKPNMGNRSTTRSLYLFVTFKIR
jgi:hypothetical protein